MTLHIITDKDCGDVVTISPTAEPEAFAGFMQGILYLDEDCAEDLHQSVVEILGMYKRDPYVHLYVGKIGRFWL